MTKEDVTMIGFEIVAYAGDARSKLMIAFGLSMIVGYIYNEDLTKVPKIISSFGEFVLGSNYNFLSGSGGEPNFFPHPTFDAWIIGIAIVFFALVATFSKVEETYS